MKRVAIIPARGGSKRIPRKNIREFAGAPIISYSINTALRSGLFDEVMVSTDDAEIAVVAQQYGATVPFLRSKKNSDDFATTVSVLVEVLESYSSLTRKFDYACCIYPTAPLITASRLIEGFNILMENDFDSVFPVLKFGYPIQRALKLNGKKIEMDYPQYLNARSQDLEPKFHDSGQFYWFSVDALLSKKAIFTDNAGAIPISELEAQDIDNDVDWQLAELKYEIINRIQ